MIELGQLEAHHAEFEKRSTKVVVASVEGLEISQEMQRQFPHLVVVADPDKKLVTAAQVLHPKGGKEGEDIAAPTTFLIDKQGIVRSMFRPKQVIARRSAKETLAAVDADLLGGK